MEIDDYILDHSNVDFDVLIENWGWCFPEGAEVAPWFITRFGDIVWLDSEDKVHLLNVTLGSNVQLADSEEAFIELLNEEDNAEALLQMELVDEVRDSQPLGDGDCYGFRLLPDLGGEYAPANIYVSSLEGYWYFCGHIHRQLVDVPDGAEVEIEIPNRPELDDDEPT